MYGPPTPTPTARVRSVVVYGLLVILAFALSAAAVAARDAGAGATTGKDADAKTKPAPTRVLKATSDHPRCDDSVELGDGLVVEVENLDALLEKARATSPAKKIILFLDGRPLKDATPYPPTDPGKSVVSFQLQRTESSHEVWTYLLGKPKWDLRPTNVSIGLEDSYPVESIASVPLRVIPHGWFTFWAVLLLGLIASFVALAVSSDLLRESGPAPASGRKAYSLSRMQAAWWFFLVLVSYLFIGMITGDFSTTITGTVLALTGISAGTVVGAAVIDAGKPVPPIIPANEFWWLDILSDANGVNFHRFQMAAWTVVLGVIFVSQVYSGLAMPTFDGTLLALSGISAGTFLGLKIPEVK